nr:hypothetical protein Q903MT_gene2386 [Picea sitchensis]
MLGLRRPYSTLEEDPAEIRGMFGHHIFDSYTLSNSVVAVRNSCYQVVPHKVSVGDRDRLDRAFTKDELFATLCSM